MDYYINSGNTHPPFYRGSSPKKAGPTLPTVSFFFKFSDLKRLFKLN